MIYHKILAAAVIFVFAMAAPASAIGPHVPFSKTTVFVSGRIKTPENRPIKGASIIVKDANTNEVVQRALSSSFGYYRLDGLETGRQYVISVTHKNYIFAFPAQLLELDQDRTNLDFVGELNQN